MYLKKVQDFVDLFERTKIFIRQFPGCNHLTLLRDTNKPNIFFTYSYWDSPEHLDAYRNSELFKDTWAQTKALFQVRAEAWSVEVASTVEDEAPHANHG